MSTVIRVLSIPYEVILTYLRVDSRQESREDSKPVPKPLTEEQKQDITRVIPVQKVGKPEDIAYAVTFLASPYASYISGETMHVNGCM